ncbi:MAG TPA: Trk system potassium transporter TrkA, partial [Candidatus Thalassarchaeaceae archaeon]
MRNFVIAGAGEVGRGIAQALIYERKNVILVDLNPDALKQASTLECLLIS